MSPRRPAPPGTGGKARPRARAKAPAKRRPASRRPGKTRDPVRAMTKAELRSLRAQLSHARRPPGRLNADPHEAQRSLARLVLALVEFLRRLMERQAVRRMDAGTLSDDEAEDIGVALMRLERTVRELARGFGLDPGELNLDLGPLGRLH